MSFFSWACCGSIASVAAGRYDCVEHVEVKIDYLLQCLGSSAVAEAVWQGVVPNAILGLQREQFGDGVPPSLRSGATFRRPAVADQE